MKFPFKTAILAPCAIFAALAHARADSQSPVYSVNSPAGYGVTFVTDSHQPEPAYHNVPLTQWIRTQTKLNPNNLSLSQLVTMEKVFGPDEFGVVTAELPFPFDAWQHHEPSVVGGSIDAGLIDTNGNFQYLSISDTARAPDGNTLLRWDINWETPGWHDFRARLIFDHGLDGDQFVLIGPPMHFYNGNACQLFPQTSTFLPDRAYLCARLREPAAKFHIRITNLQGYLINDLPGTTFNGLINLSWNLAAYDGEKYTNNSFIGYFYVTYPDDTTPNPPVKCHFHKMGTSGD